MYIQQASRNITAKSLLQTSLLRVSDAAIAGLGFVGRHDVFNLSQHPAFWPHHWGIVTTRLRATITLGPCK